MRKKEIAQKLRELRGAKSRGEVAAGVGISPSALSMYETAARIPRDDIKLRIANYYNTTVEAIFFTQQVHT